VSFARSLIAIFCLALTVPLTAQAAPAPAADMIIWGGPIYTANDKAPTAQAVAIRAGRIVYVGTKKRAWANLGPQTQVIDLKGASLFPGFTDGHVHLKGIGERELTLNLEGSKSAAEVAARLKAWMVNVKPGEVVIGRGWIETGWPEARFLSLADLDAVAPNNPVLMERADGHALTANSLALKAAGIDASTAAPFGGAILKDDKGALTGMLVDNAMNLVSGLIPTASEDFRLKALKTGMDVETHYGWTGVHAMSMPWGDVLALEALATRGEAPLRVYAAVDRDDADKLFASGRRSVADGRIVTRAIKLYADGALGSRGASLFAPYADRPDTSGLLMLQPDIFRPMIAHAAKDGIQVATHAIGDRANATVLDLYAEALPGAGSDPRWRIEHAQHIRPADIPRFASLKVIASMQPSHAIGDLHFAPARLGMDRLKGAYAWKSITLAGGVVVGGSDAPVERGDPLIEFYAVVAREDLQGYSSDGWHPEEALSRAEALRLFTVNPAFASFTEQDLGTIEVGKRADLTAFSVDLMTAPMAEIPKGHAVLTVVDGKVAFQAQ
jgi:predicted amidohydrolase YtcJ